jgi:hypothetical protein
MSMVDPTTELIAQNIQRIRLERGLGYGAVELLTEEAGFRIPSTVLRRTEKCERHVTVKDLLVLAAVLGVSPMDLMLPLPGSGDVRVTGIGEIDADEAWGWVTGSTRYGGVSA